VSNASKKSKTSTGKTGGEMTAPAALAALRDDGVGYHPVYFYEMLRAGEVEAVKVRGRWLLAKETVDRLREERLRLKKAGQNGVKHVVN
jgi:hypothetical protein